MQPSNSTGLSKSVTRTIRIEQDIDKNLEELALKERVSVNSLVNKALRKFVEWDYLANKFGFSVNFSSATTKLLNYLSEQEIKEFATWVGLSPFKEYVTFWFKTVDRESIIKGIRLLAAAADFQYEEYVDSAVHTIICKHNSGSKWSTYYESLFGCIFQKLAESDVKIESTENQVLVQLTTSKRAFLNSLYGDIQDRQNK